MKKKIVSLFVFVILVAGFQSRAQEGVVDNAVMGVDNDNQTDSVTNIFTCNSLYSENLMKVAVQSVLIGARQLQTQILIQKQGEAAKSYFPSVNYEKSQTYTKYTYEIFNDSEKLGEFSVVDSVAINNVVVKRAFCGRAGCDLPMVPSCGRDACNNPKPIVKSYKGVLKIYEKEIPFICK